MTEGWKPDWTVKPGEHVKEAREAAGLSQKAVADQWGVTQPYVANIEASRKSITARVALRLEDMGWGPALFWMNLQTHHDLVTARKARRRLPVTPPVDDRNEPRTARLNAAIEASEPDCRWDKDPDGIEICVEHSEIVLGPEGCEDSPRWWKAKAIAAIEAAQGIVEPPREGLDVAGSRFEDSPEGHSRLAVAIGDALDTERVAAFMQGPFESGELRWLGSWVASRLLGRATGRER